MLLEVALVLLCIAQILNLTRHLVRATRARRAAQEAALLVEHLDWKRSHAGRRRRLVGRLPRG